jgi:prepilin-type N-terminal cleavage/methylation domain-containing protein
MRMTKQRRQQDARMNALHRKGYSLIEMAVAILIIGLLVAPLSDVYSNYLKHKKYEATLTNVQDVLSAIQGYRMANGVFPCPSGLNVARTSPNYGAPLNCTSAGPYAVAPAFGACDLVAGICIEQSLRVAVPAFDAFHQRVMMGAIPFRQLQIPEKKAYDGYGNRLVYVITQSMGDPAMVNTLNGGISIRDPSGKALVKPADSAVFAVFASGSDGVGGWTSEGGLHAPCTGAPGADAANCNLGFEGGAATLNAVFIDSYLSTAQGANHYDDFMMYFQSQPDPLWSYVTGTTNIKDLTDQSVGVGTTTPMASVQLDVAAATNAPVLSDGSNNTDSLLVYGTANAGNAGKADVDAICDASGANCFNPVQIGGDNTVAGKGMKCGASTYMTGIDTPNNGATGGADCAPVALSCPTGQVMNGIVNGVPTCIVVPINCTAMTGPSPGVNCPTVPVPATADGASVVFSQPSWDPNGCRSVTYTCTAGNWNKTADNAATCQLAACTNPACSCTTQFNANYTGTCVLQTCPNCSGGTTTTMTVNQCTCKANTQEVENCPSPWTGGTRKRTTTYNGQNCNGSTGNWNEAQCECSRPNTTTQNVACPAGYNSGSGVMTGTLDKNSCTYNYNTSYTACTCVPPNPATRQIAVACPSPAVGTGTQNQTFNSTLGVCAWENTGQIQNCSCPANSTETQACPSPWASGNQTRPITYGAAPICQQSVGLWDTSGCGCATNYTETEACPAPANGNRTRTHTFDPACAETISAWNETACSCPANSTQFQACPAPYTGGQQSRPVTYAAPPACTQSLGNWDTSACACSLPATATQILGCGAGYNQGGITQTATLNPTTCTYGAWSETGNNCACVSPSPSTTTAACGSCSSPWSGTQSCDTSFVNNPGVTCTWGSPGAPYGCTCDTTAQPYSQVHDCSLSPYNLECYQPNLADPDTGTVSNVAGAGTCTASAPVITHQGTCTLKQFTWVNGVANGSIVNPKPSGANILGAGCGCPQHQNTLGGQQDTCYSADPFNFNQYDCDCQ